jgi:molybdate transport system substrate-binding protein
MRTFGRILLVLVLGCGAPGEDTLFILADPSCQDGLDGVGVDFARQNGVAVAHTAADPAALIRKLDNGVAADIVVSQEQWLVDYLAARDLVEKQQDGWTNRLVVIVPLSSPRTLTRLGDLAKPGMRRIAVARANLPLGQSARQALTRGGVWDKIQPSILEGADSQTVLGGVSAEEVEAGIVYATDAANAPSARIALQIPSRLHDPIRYTVILLKRPHIKSSARRFLEYLQSPQGLQTIRLSGFDVEE